MPPLRSGEIAWLASVNAETLRFYEREGLLPVPPRRASGTSGVGPPADRPCIDLRRHCGRRDVAEDRGAGCGPDPVRFALADAQHVLARSYGFRSWTELKHQVEGVKVEAFCTAVEAGDVAAVRKPAKARPELVSISPVGGTSVLHFAVFKRDAAMASALMELGSDARTGFWPHRSATAR